MLGLDITTQDFFVVGLLIFIEGVLSLDNALVLALLVKHLPLDQRRRALTWGIAGAIFFRILALFFITELIQLTWVKFAGGGYLIFLGLKELLKRKGDESLEEKSAKKAGFWQTVLLVELTDIAFAVDSILAAAALSSKLWVLILGGVLGIIMMRFAATIFSSLLDRFPDLEKTAYLLVIIVGLKLVIEGFKIEGVSFHDSGNPAFWSFWGFMLAALLFGLVSRPRKNKSA